MTPPATPSPAPTSTNRRQLLSAFGGLCALTFPPQAGWAQSPTARGGFAVNEGWIGDIPVGRVYETTCHVKAEDWFPGLHAADLQPYKNWLEPEFYDPASGQFPMLIQSWVLRASGKVVLIDACFGNDKDRPGYADADHLHTPYLQKLAQLGVTPEDVDIVICTHLHLDHVGWNTRWVDGRWAPTFPNAKYIWSRLEQENALARANDPATPAFQRPVYADSIAPIIEAGLAHPIDGESALGDHILLRPAPGHSPGHLRVEVRSGGAAAVFCGDMMHAALQIPLWRQSSMTDWNPGLAAQSRHDVLAFCADQGAILVPGHFPGAHVGRIQRVGDSFAIRFGWT